MWGSFLGPQSTAWVMGTLQLHFYWVVRTFLQVSGPIPLEVESFSRWGGRRGLKVGGAAPSLTPYTPVTEPGPQGQAGSR